MASRVEWWLTRCQLACVLLLGCALGLSWGATNVCLYAGLGVWLIRKVRAQDARVPWTPINGLLLLVCLVGVASLVNTVNLQTSLQGLRKWVRDWAALVLVWETLTSVRRLRWMAYVIAATTCVIVLDGALQRLMGYGLISRAPLALYHLKVLSTTASFWRMTTTFHHPADLGIFLVSVCPILLACSDAAPVRPWRVIIRVAALMGLTGLVLTYARGAWFGMLVALSWMAVMHRQWRWGIVGLLLAGVMVLAIPAPARAWTQHQSSLLAVLTEPDRLTFWDTSLRMIAAHPLVGVGVNTFVLQYPHYQALGTPVEGLGPYAHNNYLHLAAEVGVVGLGLALWALGRIIRLAGRAVRWASASPELQGWVLGVSAGWLAYGVNGLTESSLFASRSRVLFWWLTGWLFASLRAAAPHLITPRLWRSRV